MPDSARPLEMLLKPWPDFFEVMEDDLVAGAKLFMDAGYRYLLARPPKEFFACPGLDPEDFAIEIVSTLVRHDSRRLRRYRNQGKPFLAWFRTTAVRIAIDIIRRYNAIHGPLVGKGPDSDDDDIIDRIPTPAVDLGTADLGELIRETIRSFGDHPCHRILWMRYVEGLSNQEISRKCPEGWSNYEVGNRFRRCRLNLMEKLKKQGITPEEFT